MAVKHGARDRLIQTGDVDMIGNLKGQNNRIRFNLPTFTAGILYETNVALIRRPNPGAWNSEAFLTPIKLEVRFDVLIRRPYAAGVRSWDSR